MISREFGSDPPYTDQEVVVLANLALKRLGLTAHDERIFIQENNPFMADLAFGCEVNGREDDLFLELDRFHQTTDIQEPKIEELDLPAAYSFGGLITRKFIRLPVETPEGHSRWPMFSGYQRISPHGINSLQRSLGREPGFDAFELTRLDDLGTYTAREWLTGFANMQVPVAGLQNKIMAKHDTNPGDHVQSWITTPPAICRKIAERAAMLLDSPESTGSESQMSSMATALDDLAEFTKPILRNVHVFAQDTSTSELSPNNLELLAQNPDILTGGPNNMIEAYPNFAELGLFTHGVNDNRARLEKETRRVTNLYIAHTAGLLLSLEAA